MKRLLSLTVTLVAVAVLLPSAAQAQMGTARGKVVDDQGQPVPDAKIELSFLGGVTRNYETKTNKKGEFTQVGLQPGNYRVTATKEGFQAAYIEHRISLGDPTYLPEFRLTTKAKAAAAAAQKAQEDIGPLFKKALDLTQAGQLDEAEAAYKEILAKHADIPEVHYNLGYIYMQRKDYTSAEAAYLKALEVKPGYGDATVALARVYQESGQKEKAMELMTKAASGEGGDAKVHFNLGIFYLNQQKNAEAEAAFKKAEQLDPANAEVHYYLGTLALNSGKADECIARLEKYLSMSPTHEQNVKTAQGLLQALKPKK
jgi:tetratricopeptide (TPR) repeat protein